MRLTAVVKWWVFVLIDSLDCIGNWPSVYEGYMFLSGQITLHQDPVTKQYKT